jgi:hypothetical protein
MFWTPIEIYRHVQFPVSNPGAALKVKRSKALVTGVAPEGSACTAAGSYEFIEVDPHPLGISIKIPMRIAQSGDPLILPMPLDLRDAVLRALHQFERTIQ